MPPKRRALAECAFVLSAIFAPGLGASAAGWWSNAPTVVFIVCAAWGAALAFRRPVAAIALLVALGTALWAVGGERTAAPPRLGVHLEDRDGHAEVTDVVPGSPADGTLVARDRITAVAGIPLDAAAPVADLKARLRGDRLPSGPTGFTVLRGGTTMEVTIPLATVPGGLTRETLSWVVLRALAVLLVVAVVLRLDGQSARHVGLAPGRLPTEVLFGVPVLLATLMVHVGVTIPLGVLLAMSDRAGGEVAQRMSALTGLGAGLSLGWFALAMIVVALFEEVVFRGFLLPRVRHLTGRWWLGVVLVPALFGLGHLYEGTVAVVQTAVLGVCFSVAFIRRGHLGSTIAAHAAFNTMMFVLVTALAERLGR